MRKRARLFDTRKEEYNANDSISQLPEEILVSILSRLTLKEAASTSILSRRFRNSWTLVESLDFSNEDALARIVENPKSRVPERAKYINWVNRTLKQQKGPTVQKFKICFDLDKTSKCALDYWIKFAISKKISKLELDLLEYGNSIRQTMRSYTFPLKLFNLLKASSGFGHLKFLSLRCVNVSDQALEFLLSNCPNLESVSVHGSGDFEHVKVIGKSLKLSYFEIVFCIGVKTIEIRDTNLTTFCYLGPGVDFIIEDTPMLEELSVGMGRAGIENNVFGQLSCCFNQIGILTLVIYHPQNDMNISNIPKLPKLKELELKVGAWHDDSLLQLSSLMKGCPSIERFALQLIWLKPSKIRRRIHEGEEILLKSLKLVEYLGYFGRTTDAELAMYFFRNAPELRKMIIDPRNQFLDHSCLTEGQKRIEEAAREHAKQYVKSRAPPRLDLVIL